MSNDGLSGVPGSRPQQSSYGEHQLSYFEQVGTASHPIPGMSETGQIDPQSHPIKSSEGSPPPNSATTSGSTSTPSSSEGLSSSGDGKLHHDPSRGPTSHYHPPTIPRGGEDWHVPGAEGVIHQPYTDSTRNVAASGTEVSFPDVAEGNYNSSAYPSAIKLLVSNNVAGSIIGRSGQTISELQTQSSARIKLSQTGDYYPGTQDRVCLVQGQLENVKLAVRLLLERLHLLQGQQYSQHPSWQQNQVDTVSPPSTGFDFVVRLLVPSTSCGMIIGKAGANIKHMEESSGVSSVRLSPKEVVDPNNPTAAIVSGTGERVVTLTGPTIESCLKCLCIVLDGMSANHDICRYTNMTTSYSRLMVPSAYTPLQPTRGLLVVPSPTGEWDTSGQYDHFGAKRSTSQPDLTQIGVDQQRGSSRMLPDSPGQSRDMQQYSPVFPDVAPSYSQEMPPTMPSPARGPPTNPPPAASPMYLFQAPGTTQLEHPNLPNSSSAPDLLAMQFQDSMRISTPPISAPVDYNHFAPQLPQPTPPGFTAQVLVPDTLIGSILGRGGKTLNELQMHSNTRIRISQRGEYIPGTRNRIVTIRGPTAHSVSLAQYLMSQRMVLPPTATYSPQAAAAPPPPFLHPPQLQQPPHLLHQQPPQQLPPQTSHVAPSPHHSTVVPLAASQQPTLQEGSFLPAEQNPVGSSAVSSSSLTITRNSSSKELLPKQNS
ncbi:KH domain containing protein [Nitzschia inconspicua]|uniref:KH domain containing protein n=1 Tax=Nitzschia inconspicua TaxID=303405 RepID=A0A9K3KP71_9STRA|nr:KH domain containing protein [Nitzschia inconspicua]